MPHNTRVAVCEKNGSELWRRVNFQIIDSDISLPVYKGTLYQLLVLPYFDIGWWSYRNVTLYCQEWWHCERSGRWMGGLVVGWGEEEKSG